MRGSKRKGKTKRNHTKKKKLKNCSKLEIQQRLVLVKGIFVQGYLLPFGNRRKNKKE